MEVGDKNRLHATMGDFEAAMVKSKITLDAAPVDCVVVAFDRTSRDETLASLAVGIAKRTSAKVVAIQRPHSDDARVYAEGVFNRVSGGAANVMIDTDAREGPLHKQIMAAADEHKAALVIVASPYGTEIEDAGEESLSTTTEALFAEYKRPLLIVRHARANAEGLWSSVVVASTFRAEDATGPAAMALRLVAKAGMITLLAVADRTVIAEAAGLLGDAVKLGALDEDALKRAEQRAIGGLVAAVQKAAGEHHVNATVDVQCGNPSAVVPAHAEAHPCVIAVGRTADHSSPTYHTAIDIVLASKCPVLVV